jgi:hypothetical protein
MLYELCAISFHQVFSHVVINDDADNNTCGDVTAYLRHSMVG